MKDIRKIVSLLSFVTLIFIKVSGFHVYSHHSEDSHEAIANCASCELAIEQEQDDFIPPASTQAEESAVAIESKTVALSLKSFITDAVPLDFFSRPPPFTI